MDRRKFFSFLAAAPVAAAVVKEVAAAANAEETPQFPVGFIVDEAYVVPDYGHAYYTVNDPCHSHGVLPLRSSDLPSHSHTVTGVYASRAVVRRKIYDGKQFVDFDSAAGAAVINSVLAGRARA